MSKIKKFIQRFGLKKEKIIFCYFKPSRYYYTPLDIGYLLAILKKNGFFRKYDFEMKPVPDYLYLKDEKAELKMEEIVDYCSKEKPRAVFFFTDNLLVSLFRGAEMTQEIAIRIRQKNPKIILGMQSYKFNNEQMRRILASRVFSYLIPGNPEKVFLSLDEMTKKEKVVGAPRSFLEIGLEEDKSSIQKKPLAPWLDEENPSPYLSGALKKFLKNKKQETAGRFIPILQSMRGCPFRCHYCPRSLKFEKVRFFSPTRFYDEVEYLISKFGFLNFVVVDEIFNVTLSRLEEFLREFEKRKKKNKNLAKARFSVMIRPDNLDEETIELLEKLNVKSVQIGLQTVKPDLQRYMNRVAFPKDLEHLAIKLKEAKIEFLLDIIAGLPGDTFEWFEKTVDFAVSLRPERIQVKQLFLTPGTLFDREKDKLGIETRRREDFSLEPYVVTGKGLDKGYFEKAYVYVKKKKEENSQIKWVVSFEQGHLMSTRFYQID